MSVVTLLMALLGAWFAGAVRAPGPWQRGATALPEIVANDNRRPAGVLRDGALRIHLDVAEGSWHPELAGPQRKILAFAEDGHAPSNPGPMIRVRTGTRVSATVSNRSSTSLTLHGLSDRAAAPADLRLAAGASVEATFTIGSPGTYFYWATAGEPFETRTGPDSQLNGAIVVDPAGDVPEDRVFVIGHYRSGGPTGLDSYVINGRSWPDTEPLSYRVGARIRWRWINPSSSQHPLHLHGQYFRVLRDGDNQSDWNRSPVIPSLVVTENLQVGRTMLMEWTAREAGRWLFHCHILFHVIPDNRLPLPEWYAEYADLPHDQHMSGLVLGITITGAATAAPRSAAAPRQLTLTAAERPGVSFETEGLKVPGLGYALGDAAAAAPGPALVLTKNQPVEITVVNHLTHATSVHWHGIELESYYDGVPHWDGDDRRTTPYIEPGQRFVARFTPPRAGTFIYHTHFNDFVQLSSGLYGALIVVDPSAPFDPAVDHAFVISRGGVSDEDSPVLVNGAVTAAPTTLRAGVTHRLRLVGITPVQTTRVRLMSGDRVLTWRAVAKDGADLDASAATARTAEVRLAPGETYDFAVTPAGPGNLRLDVELVSPTKTLRAVAPLVVK
jgi:FtsP/CotA-like multicopper oxidase with cupredoxin domain